MERKEAIEVIKKNWPDSSFTMLREALETLVPELKESEDERIRKGIIRNLEYLMDRAEGFVKDELEERIAWLEKQGSQNLANSAKTCKDEQKPTWSEEDERLLSKLQTYVDLECFDRECNGQDLIDWLKSLKDRCTWKPSERQKEALLWCVVHLGGADKQTLGELLEALNKL